MGILRYANVWDPSNNQDEDPIVSLVLMKIDIITFCMITTNVLAFIAAADWFNEVYRLMMGYIVMVDLAVFMVLREELRPATEQTRVLLKALDKFGFIANMYGVYWTLRSLWVARERPLLRLMLAFVWFFSLLVFVGVFGSTDSEGWQNNFAPTYY
ncbi:MAG: hypothetical protein M1820_002850 [Bogoriella megaspora]|nr:MAG: hypothetical protein M1820_002850 [Bogoriella megaspora]